MPKPAFRRMRWLLPLVLLLAGAAFLLPGLGRLVVNREQELRVALTARAMAEGGSWVYPVYMGEPRLRKPPMMYWLVAGAYRLAGTTRSALVARLPAAAAGALMVLLVYGIGARLLGRRRGFLSAMICLSSFIFLRQARLAETDIPLALFTTAAVFAGFRALMGAPPWRWWITAGATAGVGFLFKGPAAPALPILAWLAFAAASRARLRRFASPALPVAILLFAALALPWYWLILHHGRTGAENQLEKELSATFTESHHAGPIYYYVYTIFHAMAPWSLLLPFALAGLWKKRRRHANLQFLLLWFVTTFAALSAIDSKQIHYATLLVAPSSLIAGWWLGRALAPGRPRPQPARALIVLLLGIGAAAGFALAGYALHQPASAERAPLLASALAGGLLALAGYLLPAEPPRRLAALFGAMLFLHLAVALFIVPQRKEQRVLAETLDAARAEIAAAPRVVASGSSHPIVQFYAGRPVEFAGSLPEAWRIAEPGDVVVLAFRSGPDEGFQADGGQRIAAGVRGGLHCEVFVKR